MSGRNRASRGGRSVPVLNIVAHGVCVSLSFTLRVCVRGIENNQLCCPVFIDYGSRIYRDPTRILRNEKKNQSIK